MELVDSDDELCALVGMEHTINPVSSVQANETTSLRIPNNSDANGCDSDSDDFVTPKISKKTKKLSNASTASKTHVSVVLDDVPWICQCGYKNTPIFGEVFNDCWICCSRRT